MKRRRPARYASALAAAATLLTGAVACSSGGSGTAGTAGGAGSAAVAGTVGTNAKVTLTLWMGYTPPPPPSQGAEYLSLQKIVSDFTKLHPNIHINMEYVNSDTALEKLTVALQGGQPPDITYQYGSSMPQIANTPQVVDLTQLVKQPGWNWNDFFPGERAVATVSGRVLGIPALVDNLAVVYNKTLFQQHHLAPPAQGWTWSELAADAQAISDPAQKVFGLAFPADGSETMVWQYEAMLWEAGGDILSSDNSKAAFDSQAGTTALATLRAMQQNRALYLDFHPDAGQSETLFNSGKIGMIITGPWDLASFPNVGYGVQVMPSFAPGGSHQSISGPDNWVVFNNGQDREAAALEFLKYLTSPQVLLQNSLATGDLPTRASVQQLPGFSQFAAKYPGIGLYAQNLANVLRARPQITAYPRISAALGRALVAALLGQATPAAALGDASQQANSFLAISG